MRTLLLLPLLMMLVAPGQDGAVSDDGSPVSVLSFKWSKSRQVVAYPNAASTGPAPTVISSSKNFERNRRVNDTAEVKDPNADTIDGRSAALEQIVQESRSPKSKPVDGFAYRVKIRNASAKVVEVIFWEYQFKETANPANVARRQFLCGVNIKPNKEKELQSFSPAGPGDVVSAESLDNQTGKLFEEKVVINRVEYADGAIWQRRGWSFAEVRSAVARTTATPWGTEMCRGL
jgi:hypothetical protein